MGTQVEILGANSKYEFNSGAKNFTEAEYDCRNKKGKLLEINSAEENQYLQTKYLHSFSSTIPSASFFLGRFEYYSVRI